MASELGSFEDSTGQRLTYTGLSIDLPSNLALSLGLAIHELTTNAVKHGALLVPDGRVAITWKLIDTETKARMLKLSWIEYGGPAVEAPKTRGFGSTLLESIFAGQPGAQVELKYARTGLQFHTTLPCRMAESNTNQKADSAVGFDRSAMADCGDGRSPAG